MYIKVWFVFRDFLLVVLSLQVWKTLETPEMGVLTRIY